MAETAALFAPPTVTPPREPLPTWRALLAIGRNPLEIWDEAAFHEPYRTGPWLGRTYHRLSDPELIEAAFLDQADAFVKSETVRRVLAPAGPDGLFMSEGAKWKRQRRAAAPAFRNEALQSLVPVMTQAGEAAAARLLAAGEGGQAADVLPDMARATLDVIVETMLQGADEHAVDREAMGREVTAFLDTIGRVDAATALGVPQWARLDRLRGMLAIAAMQATAARALRLRRDAGGEARDLIGRLVQARDPETGGALTDGELRDNILTFMVAGHETTAVALSWTLYLIAHDASVQESLHAEARAVVGEGPVRAEHLDRLELHERVLKEAMRLFPPAPVMERVAVRDVTLLPGVHIKAGETVATLIYVMHRAPRLWDNPAAFDPDRFLTERSAGRHRFAYIPFGAGPRICIGMRLAMMEAIAILASIALRARVAPSPGPSPTPLMRITLRPHPGMPLLIQKR